MTKWKRTNEKELLEMIYLNDTYKIKYNGRHLTKYRMLFVVLHTQKMIEILHLFEYFFF